VVVFNFPAGDTVIHADEYESLRPYYDVKRDAAQGSPKDKMVLADPVNYPIVVHPVDKSDNYIKRCVGIAGDTIEVRDGVVYANGVMEENPPYSELNYVVTTNAGSLNPELMKEEYDLDVEK